MKKYMGCLVLLLAACASDPKPKPVTDQDVKLSLQQVLQNQTQLNAEKVVVEVKGATVLLTGSVRSIEEKNQVERLIQQAAGNATVYNQLVIRR